MQPSVIRVLRRYLWLVGAVLLVQGILTLVALALVDGASEATRGFLNPDWLHGAIHVAWGVAMVALLRRRVDERLLRWAAVAFGVFYLALTVLGILIHQPFGLHLGPSEHGFHLIIGVPALLLGAASWWAARRPAVSAFAPQLGPR